MRQALVRFLRSILDSILGLQQEPYVQHCGEQNCLCVFTRGENVVYSTAVSKIVCVCVTRGENNVLYKW